ncbi:unnamed protein product [Dovyalis caffra]|uniref:RNA methyltransferase n=1 Tax=Dovyalis caffra TaxID=77055 RepID=A0AAV1RM08_9ROSI|nr:unnamed protein product [Dovyalis caffra]
MTIELNKLPGGILVLEPQPWQSYEKNRRVSETAAMNYRTIMFRPESFREILLDKIGFRRVEDITAGLSGSKTGFDRPIFCLWKICKWGSVDDLGNVCDPFSSLSLSLKLWSAFVTVSNYYVYNAKPFAHSFKNPWDASDFPYAQFHPTMYSGDKSSKVSRLFCNVEQQSHTFSNHSITALYSKPKTLVDNFGCMKRVAIREPAGKGRGRGAKRTIAMVLEVPDEKDSSKSSGILEEDLGLESDPESSCHEGSDVTLNDEECNIDEELFYHEGARKKLKLLADMVGADTEEPGFVLAKVVAVLKNFMKSGNGDVYLPKK